MVFTDSAPSLPCNWDVDTECCSEWDTYSTELQTAAMEYGALVVWAATGRRFGLCERTVRPCGRSGSATNAPYGYYWAAGTWMPYVFGGVWRNCSGCDVTALGCCTCEPRCQVYLPAPVYSIPATGISIGNEIIPVDSWRIDNAQWLVRTDGDCWPECQDFNTDSGDTFFQVTYFRGQPVPGVLLRAAGELACEWARSCSGADCRLPQRVSSVSRQGVSVSMTDIDVLLKDGLTGVTTVDQVIMMFNPYRLTSQMKIASPDWPPMSRTVSYP